MPQKTSSGSQFFRTTIVIQSGPDTFGKIKVRYDLYNHLLGVTEISCIFTLVLEGKTGKEVPESSRLPRVLRKVFSK